MICNKCKNTGVLSSAGGQDFYYCRTCKEEIPLEAKPTDEENWLKQFEDMLRDSQEDMRKAISNYIPEDDDDFID